MSRYRDWAFDQPLLFPPSVSEFVPLDHMCLFVRDRARGATHPLIENRPSQSPLWARRPSSTRRQICDDVTRTGS